jgi:hypothetical protein
MERGVGVGRLGGALLVSCMQLGASVPSPELPLPLPRTPEHPPPLLPPLNFPAPHTPTQLSAGPRPAGLWPAQPGVSKKKMLGRRSWDLKFPKGSNRHMTLTNNPVEIRPFMTSSTIFRGWVMGPKIDHPRKTNRVASGLIWAGVRRSTILQMCAVRIRSPKLGVETWINIRRQIHR